MNLLIIGTGGTGSWLAPLLARTAKHASLILMDGDRFTAENLDRQNCLPADEGRYKADALASRLRDSGFKAAGAPMYLTSPSEITSLEADFVFGCPDNHACRRRILKWADQENKPAILCGNTNIMAHAMLYRGPIDRRTPRDPRVRYPEIVTTRDAHDPAHNCTTPPESPDGEQTALMNFTSAVAAVQLFESWLRTPPEYAETLLPCEHKFVNTCWETVKGQDAPAT